MEPLESYLTKEGWKKDLQITKKNLSSLISSCQRTDVVSIKRNGGQVPVGCLVALVTSPICALAGTYLGEGVGYVIGNMVDWIPFMRDVVPWCAERAGLVADSRHAVDLNENFYQTFVAFSGFYWGLLFPFKLLWGDNK